MENPAVKQERKMGVTENIVRFVDEASFDALPDEVVFRTKMS
jgi:hypothetical protein